MKLYGYSQNSSDLMQLQEVTFQISSEEAERLAVFFHKCSQEMNAPHWNHEHFDGGILPEVIIFRAWNLVQYNDSDEVYQSSEPSQGKK